MQAYGALLPIRRRGSQTGLLQAGLSDGNFDPYRAGVFFGSGVGGLEAFEVEFPKMVEKGPGRVSPLCIPELIANMGAAQISMALGLKGESICPVTACATGNHAIGEAYRAIKHGYQDIVVAGGAEACIIRIANAGFSNMKALYTGDDIRTASIPFDARRSGFVMGEGAGAVVLESLSHAQARGATILAEVAGYGATSDAYHITAPDPEGEGGGRLKLQCRMLEFRPIRSTISMHMAPQRQSMKKSKRWLSKRQWERQRIMSISRLPSP